MEQWGNGRVDKALRSFTDVFYSASCIVSHFYCFFFVLNDPSEAVTLKHYFLSCSHLCDVSNTVPDMYLIFASRNLHSKLKIPKWNSKGSTYCTYWCDEQGQRTGLRAVFIAWQLLHQRLWSTIGSGLWTTGGEDSVQGGSEVWVESWSMLRDSSVECHGSHL